MSDTMDKTQPISLEINDIAELGELPENVSQSVEDGGEESYRDESVSEPGSELDEEESEHGESDVEEGEVGDDEDEGDDEEESEHGESDVEESESEDEDIEEDSQVSPLEKTQSKTNKMVTEILGQEETDISDDEEDSDDEDYLTKFNESVKKDHIIQNHPELIQSNYDEITALCKVVRNENGVVIDPLHKTLPTLTKYEFTRVLGLRAKQLNSGAEPFIEIPENVIEGYVIAQMELAQKALPYIIVRPLPGGKKEYWHLRDLEIIDY
jgi:DNA-directed RNA polymerase subunit K/omega